MGSYAELHCHTNFSFLDGASHPEALVGRAAELGLEALAITDHDGFRGAVKVHRAARQVGLPVVYGTEVGMPLHPDDTGHGQGEDNVLPGPRPEPDGQVVDDGRPRRGRVRRMHGAKPPEKEPAHHLVLLAPDPGGYAAISRFVSSGQYRGRKDRPVYGYGDLAEASSQGRLVALTGCRQGAMPSAAVRGDLAGAMAAAASMRELFPDRLYVELWHHAMPEDDLRNDVMAEAAARLGLPVVATNNVHYADPGDADLAEVLAAVAGRRPLDAADGFRPATDQRHLRRPDDMARRFARYPGAVETAAELGASLAFDLDLLTPRLPDFPMPGGFATEDAFLRHLVMEGARTVYPGTGTGGIDPPALQRMEHELGIIESWGLPAISWSSGTSSISPGPRTSTAR